MTRLNSVGKLLVCFWFIPIWLIGSLVAFSIGCLLDMTKEMWDTWKKSYAAGYNQ